MSAYHSDYCSTAQNSSHNIPTYQVLSMEGSVASRGKKNLENDSHRHTGASKSKTSTFQNIFHSQQFVEDR